MPGETGVAMRLPLRYTPSGVPELMLEFLLKPSTTIVLLTERCGACAFPTPLDDSKLSSHPFALLVPSPVPPMASTLSRGLMGPFCAFSRPDLLVDLNRAPSLGAAAMRRIWGGSQIPWILHGILCMAIMGRARAPAPCTVCRLAN